MVAEDHGVRPVFSAPAGAPAPTSFQLVRSNIELGGELVEGDGLLVARRGRLVERLAGWSRETALAFSEACALRARDRAARALRRHGFASEAAELATAQALQEIEETAAGLSAHVGGFPGSHAAFAADAVALARGARPEAWRSAEATANVLQKPATTAANLGFVVAHGAGLEAADEHGPGAYDAGFAAERSAQAAWLAERVGL